MGNSPGRFVAILLIENRKVAKEIAIFTSATMSGHDVERDIYQRPQQASGKEFHMVRLAIHARLKVRGRWVYLYRAVDKAGWTVDFFPSRNRDTNAAQTFLRKAIKNRAHRPRSRWTPMRHHIAQSGK